MGWWIALGILILLAVLPLGADVLYNAAGFRAAVVAGPFHITVFPLKKKEEKPKKEKQDDDVAQPKQESEKKQEHKAGKPAPAGSWTDFLPLVQVALDFLGDLRRKIRIDLLEMNLIMAGDDPCDLAINYGRGWAALGNLIPALNRAFVIKKQDVKLQCDFTASETKVSAHIVITITLGRVISLAVRYGIRALREFLKINKQRKGGATI